MHFDPNLLQKAGVDLTKDPEELYDGIEEIGSGSYGNVFKGRDVNTSKIVAIKTIVLEKDEDITDVVNEIGVLKEVCHQNCVMYYGAYLKKDTLWIIMEYCNGGSLCDLMDLSQRNQNYFTEKQIAYIIREVVKGLAYLHNNAGKKAIIHRDIKTGNILMTDTGLIKLCDFGVSAQLIRTVSHRDTFIGTPYYMAPECDILGIFWSAYTNHNDINQIIHSKPYDSSADIWSVGITCIEMADGFPPHSELHPMKALFVIARADSPTLKNPNEWSPELNDFLSQCLAISPSDRPTAEELLSHPFLSGQLNRVLVADSISEYLDDKARGATIRRKKLSCMSDNEAYGTTDSQEEVKKMVYSPSLTPNDGDTVVEKVQPLDTVKELDSLDANESTHTEPSEVPLVSDSHNVENTVSDAVTESTPLSTETEKELPLPVDIGSMNNGKKVVKQRKKSRHSQNPHADNISDALGLWETPEKDEKTGESESVPKVKSVVEKDIQNSENVMMSKKEKEEYFSARTWAIAAGVGVVVLAISVVWMKRCRCCFYPTSSPQTTPIQRIIIETNRDIMVSPGES